MIRFILILAVICNVVWAAEQDDVYYPERIEWHKVQRMVEDSHTFVHWEYGKYLRLRFDERPSEFTAIWFSQGDGLFQQKAPNHVVQRNGQWHWLFARAKQSHALVMVEHEGLSVSIEQSKHSTAPNLTVVSDRIVHSQQQVLTNRSEGFHQDIANRILAGQRLEYALEGPAQYTFVLRSQWQEDYGLSQLMDLQLKVDSQQPIEKTVKIQPQTNYLLQTDKCECVYSRATTVRLFIPEGTHTVYVTPDREILGYWSQLNQNEQFFYQRNVRQPLKQQPLAIVDEAFVGVNEMPTLFHYRQLSPHNAIKLNAVKITPQDDEAKYFAQIEAGQHADYPIPLTSHQPPLRLHLQATEQVQNIVVLSDEGESKKLIYLPQTAFKEKQGLTATQQIEFKKPFRTVQIHNRSEDGINAYLGYKNNSHQSTDERGFVSQIDKTTAKVVIDRLSTNSTQSTRSALLNSEFVQWKKRLWARYQGFLSQYPVMALQDQDLKTVMLKLSAYKGVDITNLEQLIEVLSKSKGKKVLAALAMQKQGEHQLQAQTLFLAGLAAKERWFDIEGYWVYRFIHHKQTRSIIELAQVLFRQNQFEQASKWFWLAYQAGLMTQVPVEAIMASQQSGFKQIFIQDEFDLPTQWHYWRKVIAKQIKGSAGELIHNRALDGYLSALKLDGQKVQLTGPLRLKLTVYPKKDKVEAWAEADWLTVSTAQESWRYLIEKRLDSTNLVSATDDASVLGSPKTIIFDLPEGEHQVSFNLAKHKALFTLHQQANLRGEWLVDNNDQRLKPTTKISMAFENAGETTLLQQIEDVASADRTALLLRAVQIKPISVSLTAAINALINKYPQDESEWLKLINDGYSWQRLQSVTSSAGNTILSRETWQPSSPYMQLQQAMLMQTVESGERLLSKVNTEVILLDTVKEQQLVLRLRQFTRFGDEVLPTAVMLVHNGQSQLLNLSPDNPVRHKLLLTPGSHKISLSFAEPNGGWVFFQMANANSESQLPLIKSKYHVANKAQPLKIHVPASSWLRIDELDSSGQSNTQMRYFATEQTLALTSTSLSYFQVFQWQVNRLKPFVAPQVTVQIESNHTVEVTHWAPWVDNAFAVYDKYEPEEQTGSTWGLFSGYRARLNFDEHEQTAKEKFFQTGWQYRRNIPDWNSHMSSKFSIREHRASGLQTLVNENFGVWRRSRYFDYSTRLNAFYQYRAPLAAIEGGWSIYASMAMNWKQFWQDDVDNKVSFSAFGRVLSLTENDVYPGNTETPGNEVIEDGRSVDDDVFSDYKDDNPHGLRISDTLQYSPWVDTKLRLFGSLTSNKRGNFFDPQRLSLSAGIRQYIQPVIIKLDWQHVRFNTKRADLDGFDVSRRNSLKLGVTWENWSRSGQLWQIDGFVTSDLKSGDSSFGINFSWDISHGQGYDDFAPSQLAFGNLRRRMSFHDIQTNQVVSDSHE